jgi:hypothetical protein
MSFTESLAKPKVITAIAAAAISVLGLAIILGAYVSTRNGVADRETNLNAQYTDCQNTLSSYTASIKEALGVANASSAALNTVLTDVVKGRYETGSTANPSGGSAFSAIIESYPDLSGVTINFQNVQTAIFAGRDAFKNCNTMLVDKIRDFDLYQRRGLITPLMVNIVGAPTNGLEARKGETILTGQAALAQMKDLPMTSEATKTYDTGIDEGIDTNPQPTPAP